ncbi:hypothetical protein Ae201684P_011125 [Aphanomyces euteiches]|uniref:ABC transporter domain-containing protein n=1 Tax=Aphanomyces euteiches TaxID=100861 RepID=A0A6G0XXK2_9STRA|nr:hypothetical protein Ae201684_000354 [Aphanomyces euteiches]KAH9091580.1 hypothetical protein Ae201684P_011125 [Aphanomyces euteiches]
MSKSRHDSGFVAMPIPEDVSVNIDLQIESTEGAPPPSIASIFPSIDQTDETASEHERRTTERRMSLNVPPPPEIPRVYSELHFKGIQDPYNNEQQENNLMVSTLNLSDVDSMLNGGLRKFFEKVKKLSTAVNVQLQTPEIRFKDLTFTARSTVTPPGEVDGTVGSYLRKLFCPLARRPYIDTTILHPMTGIIPPGSMTLLLANPGAGKSTFLKALAGKLHTRRGSTYFGGEVKYSGLTASDIDLSKLVSLVDQRDNHCATLTVRETFKFADLCLNGPPRKRSHLEKLAEVANLRTELMIHVLGLSNCADTVVGDALLRGVSGGERKRVTVGEMLVGGQSIFLCDEISTGLDSAATFDIVNALRSWTKTLGGSCIVALLQPPPEVVELFDDILMLSEGYLVYHGPRQSTLPYFQNLGFTCPPRTDPSDFLIEIVSGRGAKYYPTDVEKPPLCTAKEFSDAFISSDIHTNVQATIARGDTIHDVATIKRISHMARKTQVFGMGFLESTKLLTIRQKILTLRDKPLLYGKLCEAVVVGLLLGVIYYDCKKSLYLRMCFFSIAIFQRQAWQRITISFALRNVFYKQRSRNFFRTTSYVIADTLIQIPINLVVSIVMGTIFYFMSGLTREASNYFLFLAILVVFQHAIGAYFTLLSSLAPSITMAQAAAGISVAFFLLFSGNIILSDLIPSYWRWMYWLNPLAWALRSVMLDEFTSSSYTDADSAKNLKSFQIFADKSYILHGILVLLGYFFFFTFINTLALHFVRYEEHKSVKPNADAAEAANSNVHVEVQVRQNNDETNELKFIPAFLTVQDLDYIVTLPTGEEKQLLHNVTAFFEPGTMTALMGSSGAGKTTFMDVIAGRKTGGRILGKISINGELKDPAIFSRITAYCEQMDIHSERATIREALEFSTFLRLPETISAKAKLGLVEETLRLLELDTIAHELILHLSVEQKKRVTIGVEVVANPSILFLDEPTSGLDARAAQVVMRGVQSIARTGRTVVCTIHQPSIQIFELFDSLLLLQKAGRVAYFGELGHDSQHMLEYFQHIPSTEKIKPSYNPATYMLEVIGAGIGRKDIKNYADEYAASALCQQNIKESARLSAQSSEMVRFSTLKYQPIATGLRNQMAWVITKSTRTYWRSPAYNFVRIILFPIFALIFGSTFYMLAMDTQAKVNSHVALIYNSMDFIGVINMMTVLDITCLERAVYYRERMSNYYSVLPYSVSLFVAEIPYLLLISAFFVGVEYWMVDWYNDAARFFFFWFTFFLYISLCTFLGQWMSVLLPNSKVANVAVGAISCLLNLFSGFLLPFVSMKWGYKWVTWIMPSSYALNVLVGSEVAYCTDDHHGHGCNIITLSNGSNSTIQDYILTNFGFDSSQQYSSLGILVLEWICLQIFIYLTLKYVCHLKR